MGEFDDGFEDEYTGFLAGTDDQIPSGGDTGGGTVGFEKPEKPKLEVVEDLDKVDDFARNSLAKHQAHLITTVTAELRSWRSLGKDLVHGAMLACIPGERTQLKADLAEAIDAKHKLEMENDALVLSNQALDERIKKLRFPMPVAQRGVDFACESCGKLEGNFVQEGWYRCNACGYPSK